jgi:GT2 family glycosyltransferase/SAM-dependent methyltransferase/glycosyltransferase involved in cell wall biosynthesis
MEFTGERFVPGTHGRLEVEHLQRYALCLELARGRRVLDIACGEGYGSAMLASVATQVVGIDADPSAVAHARERYAHARLSFAVGRCEAIPLSDASVDVIVCFETIEHLAAQRATIAEMSRVLVPGGLLIISTPDREPYAHDTESSNRFHVAELSLPEFRALLANEFAHVALWGQRPAIGMFTFPLDHAADTTYRGLLVEDATMREGAARLPAAIYAIAVCSRSPLPNVRLESIALDAADDNYRTLVDALRAYRDDAESLRGVVTLVRDELTDARSQLTDSRGQLVDTRVQLATEKAARRAAEIEHEATVRRLEAVIDGLRSELETTISSRSWRMTAPLRDARRTAAGIKHRSALAAERRMRALYRKLPLKGQSRWKLKSAVFNRLGWLMRGTASYQHWDGTQRRALGAAQGLPRHTSPTSGSSGGPLRLPASDSPEVSVIIPVYGQLDHTLRCLESISRHAPTVPFEVLVVDDASPEPMDALEDVDGVRVVRNSANLGFIGSCNRGAAEARGRLLLFLNNDVEVLPGWCDELAATFESVPAAGIVGSKLIYPDGRLQEAGGIVWNDGTAWNFGRHDDPAKPEYSYRRLVDYVSGASLMIPADLFHGVGGFDTLYTPAYGEDSDLAFKVRSVGREVVFQPLSQIIHYEGVTSGTDVSQGVKAYQVENQKKLFRRWEETLSAQFAPGTRVLEARERHTGPRILVLDLCTPEPDKDAGSITAFNIMRVLQGIGCKITFAPVDNFLYLERYTSNLQRLGIECLYAPFVVSIADYLREYGSLFDAVLIFRFTAARRHLDEVRRYAPRAKVLFHTSDLHYLREQREADLRGDAQIQQRAERMKREELDVMRRVDATIVHSTHEQDLLARELPGARVVVFGWAIDVPGTSAPFRTRRDVAFIGGYQHPPNVDGAMYFATQVLPLVRQQLPDVRFHVVGSNPPAELRALQDDTTTITGFVQDLGPLLDRIRLSVAPLRYGAGIKGKIGTSLSHGLPCVATPLAAEGMPLVDGREILVATTPEEFAAAVVRAYTDEALWTRLSENGLAFVRAQYSFDGAEALFTGLLQSVGVDPAPVMANGGRQRG